jgi:hypothetical protein
MIYPTRGRWTAPNIKTDTKAPPWSNHGNPPPRNAARAQAEAAWRTVTTRPLAATPTEGQNDGLL